MIFKESNKIENCAEKNAARKWNTMDPFKRNDVLFELLFRNKIQAYEITDFRQGYDFDQLPPHIRKDLIEYWGNG